MFPTLSKVRLRKASGRHGEVIWSPILRNDATKASGHASPEHKAPPATFNEKGRYRIHRKFIADSSLSSSVFLMKAHTLEKSDPQWLRDVGTAE
jgi:hypothetical protein